MRALGIILAGGNNNRMRELSNRRAIAAMPVAGSYRSIDFALSNMTNSHIAKVAVLTQYNARSLNEHLSSSKWWNFGRKQGGLFVFTPTITPDNSFWYQGTADAIYQNLDFLKRSHEPYVVIASGDCVYKLDYNKVLEYHIAKRADVTIVCKDVDANMKNLSKGVKVDVLENVVCVNLNLNLEYGYSIPETCKKVQEKVKTAIENMTGLEVSDVNISIAGVALEEEK